jgi:hypothetical protein
MAIVRAREISRNMRLPSSTGWISASGDPGKPEPIVAAIMAPTRVPTKPIRWNPVSC